jgi:hypothetical protein
VVSGQVRDLISTDMPVGVAKPLLQLRRIR